MNTLISWVVFVVAREIFNVCPVDRYPALAPRLKGRKLTEPKRLLGMYPRVQRRLQDSPFPFLFLCTSKAEAEQGQALVVLARNRCDEAPPIRWGRSSPPHGGRDARTPDRAARTTIRESPDIGEPLASWQRIVTDGLTRIYTDGSIAVAPSRRLRKIDTRAPSGGAKIGIRPLSLVAGRRGIGSSGFRARDRSAQHMRRSR